MATLTETAYYTRLGLKLSAIVLVAYILLRFVFIFTIAFIKSLNPPAPAMPSMGFGLLPPIQFPAAQPYNVQFQLQTPTGGFPSFSDRIKVYYMPYQKPNLRAPDMARTKAKLMQFYEGETEVSADTFEWVKLVPAKLTLKINYVNGAFDLNYQWQSDASLLTEKPLPGKDQSIQIARQLFNTLGENIPDIPFEKGEVTYYKATGNRMVPAMSLSEADFVKLDFFRNAIETYEVVTPKPEDGIISLVLSGSPNHDRQYVSINYNYFPVSYYQVETYPLKPVAIAWEELKKGQAYIAKSEENKTDVIIRKITLGYFDSKVAQQFLQPVYVFSGDYGNNETFIAYVPAASNDLPKDRKYSREREQVSTAPSTDTTSGNMQINTTK